MTDKMLVRLQGGDVVRRRINRTNTLQFNHSDLGAIRIDQLEPVLADDEMLLRSIGDPIPTIVNTR